MATPQIDLPRWARDFLRPARYKAAYGGRGSAKSHTFATLWLLRALSRGTRAVMIREVQNTIRDSVRQLLCDKISAHGLDHLFDIQRDEIRGPHDTLAIFRGMQSYNAENIKSLEDFDLAWVEEAQTLSQRSLDLLRPTIRSEASELWFSWNPRHEADPVDKFFRGGNPPPDAIIRQVNWQDNPWFPDVLRREMEADYASDPERAEHVWGGGYEIVSEASYYARWIAAAEREGRIRPVERIRHRPLMTSWDIGVDDYTAVWLWQEDGVNAYVLDFYETSGDGADAIVEATVARWGAWAGPHYLPHDVRVRDWGAGARSRVETLQGLGLRQIRPGAAMPPEDRVAATRRLLPVVVFNDTPDVRRGLAHLRRYQRKYNQAMGIWQGPLHDEHSHAADAFGEFAVNGPLRPDKPEEAPKPLYPAQASRGGGIALNVTGWDIIKERQRRRMEAT